MDLVSRAMSSKVLIVDPHAEIYRNRLATEFPALGFALAPAAAALPADVTDVDVLIGFGIDLKEDFFRAATG